MSRPAPSSLARRKWHTKSRTGCGSCKARKIKCDELRPACRNCLKKGVQCDFVRSPDRLLSPGAAPNHHELELELLHHFTIATAATLAPDTQVRDMWRVLVPQIGFSVRYVLDGIFALSALHIARYNPARRELLLAHATQYQTASLAQALPLIPRITPQNCSHLFLFGVLTLFFNLAKPRQEDDMLLLGHGVTPKWLYLLRGVYSLVHAAEEAVFASPVSLIFKSTQGSLEFWLTHSPGQNEALDELEIRIREQTTDDPERRETLLQSVQCLKRSYTFLSSSSFQDKDKMRGFYTWLFEISDGYLKLLKHADSEALCVLAFYSVLVRQLEKYWWCEGWAVHLTRRIYMLLDDEHRLWIRWPIEELGWVPEAASR